MNTRIQILATTIAAAALFPAAGQAAEQSKPAMKETKRDMRVLHGPERGGPGVRAPGPGPHKREMEKAAFLGVAVSLASPTVVAQLGLPRDSGLVVNLVEPDSPAAGVLEPHDILLKLDDQLLIEGRQLSVLIRQRKAGDEVTLVYLRGGKHATARVKLAEREVPKLSAVFERPVPGGMASFGVREGRLFDRFVPNERERVEDVLSLIPRPGAPDHFRTRIDPHGGPGFRAMSIDTANGQLVFTDDAGSLDLTIKDGAKTLVAKNAKGEELFSGPVTTPEERKAMPPEVRARLERLEGMHDITFRTDGDFQGAETKVVRPFGRSIAAPFRAPAPSQPAPGRPAHAPFF